jgi:hypothetical protein
MRAMIVGTIQFEFAQDAVENLAPASGLASGLAAVAFERRTRLIRSVGVEALLDGARRQAQNLSPRSGLDGFEIYAIGGAATQQRIHFNADVAGQLRGGRSFFWNRLPLCGRRFAPRRSFRSRPLDRASDRATGVLGDLLAGLRHESFGNDLRHCRALHIVSERPRRTVAWVVGLGTMTIQLAALAVTLNQTSGAQITQTGKLVF